MTDRITLCDILRQAKDDLFAKEVQTSPTYSYQWLACQMGHIGLGLLVFLLAVRSCGADARGMALWPYLAAVLFVAAVKEIADWLQAEHQIRGWFDARLDKCDLVADATMATFYMVLGAAFAYGALERYSAWWSLAWLALALPCVPWAMRQKMYFQQAALPYLFRLPEFPAASAGKAVGDLVDHFLDHVGPQSFRHLAITGTPGSGKTSLAVGIGTEGAFAGHIVRYITCTKLQEIGTKKEQAPSRNLVLWPWTASELLIIDDVALDPLSKPEIVEAPKPSGSRLRARDIVAALKPLGSNLRARNTVWVLDDNPDAAAAWRAAIAEILGIPVNDVDSIILGPTAASVAAMDPAHLLAALPGTAAVGQILKEP